MGYFEVYCQLCGVSFNINRIRTSDEPRYTTWGDGIREYWVTNSYFHGCVSEDGCSMVYRGDPFIAWRRGEPELLDGVVDEEEDPTYEYESASDDGNLEYDSDATDEGAGMEEEEADNGDSDLEDQEWIFRIYPIPTVHDEFLPLHQEPEKKYDSDDSSDEAYEYSNQVRETLRGFEHIAGLGCKNTQGYHGHRISLEEMRGCHTVQCLLRKGNGWVPTSDDLECELEGQYYLTGLSDHMPSGGSILRFAPGRHDTHTGDSMVEFYGMPPFEDLAVTGLPFHPTCFEIFSQASRQVFGHVDIDSLVKVRDMACLDGNDFPVKSSPDVLRAREQVWVSEVGSEYLVANPVFIPALKPILISAVSNDETFSVQDSPFQRWSAARELLDGDDPFLNLPREIVYKVLDHLHSPAIAALRLSSRAFEHLPISLWEKLVLTEMPWLYEAWSSDPKPYYWVTADPIDLKEKQKAKKKFEEKIEHERDVIQDEMLSIFEEWMKEEPKFEWPESSERQELLELSPMRLPKYKTNWYQLYRDITLNWGKLKGLQNRKRIWSDITQIMDAMKWIRDGHELNDFKFYVKQRRQQLRRVRRRR